MKTRLGTVFTLAAAAVLGLAMPSHADAPTPVQKPDFAITLPAGYGAFTEQSQSMKQDQGMIQMTTYVSKAPTGEAAIVTVSHMPAKIGDAAKVFAGTRDSLLKSLNATLEKEEKLTGDAQAESLLFHSNAATPVYFQSRLVAKDDRLYQVLYVGRTAEQRSGATVSQLFDSFRIAP